MQANQNLLEFLTHSVFTGSKRGSLGAYFTDLPPNMLGSFLMGLLAASSTLGLNTGKMLAILPAQHPWQVLTRMGEELVLFQTRTSIAIWLLVNSCEKRNSCSVAKTYDLQLPVWLDWCMESLY